MAIGSAIVNQVAGNVLRRQMGNVSSGLTKVLGNLPGTNIGRGKNTSDSAALESSQNSETINLSYPLNVETDDQQGHYILFMINSATGAKIKKSGQGKFLGHAPASESTVNPRGNLTFIDTHLNAGAGVTNKAQFQRGTPHGTMTVARPGTIRLEKAISLYMPPSVKVSYKNNYKDDPIGTIASGAAHALSTAITAGGSVTDLASLGTAVVKTFKSTLEGAAVIGAAAAKAATDTVAPGASTLAQLSMGMVLGSKMELMFTNVDRRNFNFTFNFIPKSEKEAQMVQKIIQTFKENMLPEYVGSLNVGTNVKLDQARVLKIPNTFDIHYFYKTQENPFLNRISTCYLSSMDIDYGGDKYTVYEPTQDMKDKMGTPPQRTNLSLNFNEIEIITRERAKEGF